MEVWGDQAQRQPFELYCEGFGVVFVFVFYIKASPKWDLFGISFLLYSPSSAGGKRKKQWPEPLPHLCLP